jgi:hypothetical protein
VHLSLPPPGATAAAPSSVAAEPLLPPPAGPDFADALDDLSTQVRRLQTGAEADPREGTARALRQLADVLELAPGGDAPAVSAQADRVRAAESGLLASGPPPENEAIETQSGLAAASGALLDLANGPYQAAPMVATRAHQLADEVGALGRDPSLRARRDAVVHALATAVSTLRAIEAASELPGAGNAPTVP